MLVKISGDGVKFSRSSGFVLLSFSLPGTDENVLSSSGEQAVPLTMYMFITNYFRQSYVCCFSWFGKLPPALNYVSGFRANQFSHSLSICRWV